MITEMNGKNAEEIIRAIFESIYRSYAILNYPFFLGHFLSEMMKEELSEDVVRQIILSKENKTEYQTLGLWYGY